MKIKTTRGDFKSNFEAIGKMDKVINFGIPHVGEQIFGSLEILDLVKCLKVSKTWKALTENVLVKRCAVRALEMCALGLEEVVQVLLEHPGGQNIDWNAKDFSGDSILTLACLRGHHKVVKLLLDYSKAKRIDLSSLQHDAIEACKNGHCGVVQTLFQHPEAKKINWNEHYGNYYTGFMWACQEGHANVVKVLLDHAHFGKIYFNLPARTGTPFTGFMLACLEGRENVVKIMLEHPNTKYIGKNLTYGYGRNAFGLTCERGSPRGQFAIIRLLMQHSGDKGINLNQKDIYGRTALEYACFKGHVDVVKCILDNSHGTNLEIPTVAKLENWKMNRNVKTLINDFWKK